MPKVLFVISTILVDFDNGFVVENPISPGVPISDLIAGRGAWHGCAACRGYAAAVADSPRGSHFYAPSYGSALPIATARRRDTDHIARAGDITACQPASRWHSYIAGGRLGPE